MLLLPAVLAAIDGIRLVRNRRAPGAGRYLLFSLLVSAAAFCAANSVGVPDIRFIPFAQFVVLLLALDLLCRVPARASRARAARPRPGGGHARLRADERRLHPGLGQVELRRDSNASPSIPSLQQILAALKGTPGRSARGVRTFADLRHLRQHADLREPAAPGRARDPRRRAAADGGHLAVRLLHPVAGLRAGHQRHPRLLLSGLRPRARHRAARPVQRPRLPGRVGQGQGARSIPTPAGPACSCSSRTSSIGARSLRPATCASRSSSPCSSRPRTGRRTSTVGSTRTMCSMSRWLPRARCRPPRARFFPSPTTSPTRPAAGARYDALRRSRTRCRRSRSSSRRRVRACPTTSRWPTTRTGAPTGAFGVFLASPAFMMVVPAAAGRAAPVRAQRPSTGRGSWPRSSASGSASPCRAAPREHVGASCRPVARAATARRDASRADDRAGGDRREHRRARSARSTSRGAAWHAFETQDFATRPARVRSHAPVRSRPCRRPRTRCSGGRRACSALDDCAAAIPAYEELIARAPEHIWAPESQYQIGICQQRLGQTAAAAAAFRRTIERVREQPMVAPGRRAPARARGAPPTPGPR